VNWFSAAEVMPENTASQSLSVDSTALLAARTRPFLKGDLDDISLCPPQTTPVPRDSTFSYTFGEQLRWHSNWEEN